jgi:bifunctional DNA-binding transcriptional regulator/antitoxin component of YhaV-PrlF toxin-antitoxin module
VAIITRLDVARFLKGKNASQGRAQLPAALRAQFGLSDEDVDKIMDDLDSYYLTRENNEAKNIPNAT